MHDAHPILTTRYALAKALFESDKAASAAKSNYGETFEQDVVRDHYERQADILLTSGAAIDAATMADESALVERVARTIHDHASDPTGFKAVAILRAVASHLGESA